MMKSFPLAGLLSMFWLCSVSAQNQYFPAGALQHPAAPCQNISAEFRAEGIASDRRFIAENDLRSFITRPLSDSVRFEFPLKPSDSLNGWGYYVIASLPDHDSSYPNKLLDYNGGTRTYDRANGFNHPGTDFALYPFQWLSMDRDLVSVVAMADGIILEKFDGVFDKSCETGDNMPWNALYVLHQNGIIAWYGHLKKNSLTAKNAGDTIKAGEHIGFIGSSGSSTSPHLHLELHDTTGNIIDPWEGPFNYTITQSLWKDQKPYYDPAVLLLGSHARVPEYPPCPQTEIVYEKNSFYTGDTIHLITHYRDILHDDSTFYEIVMPNGTVWASWNHVWDGPYSASLSYRWYIILHEQEPEGWWQYRVRFKDSVYTHSFFLERSTGGIPKSTGTAETFTLYQNYPNPFNPVTWIEYNLEASSYVEIRLFDLLGRHVAELERSYQQAGMHKLQFDASSLPSGIYICTIHVPSLDRLQRQSRSIIMHLIK